MLARDFGESWRTKAWWSPTATSPGGPDEQLR
jgi:hypothetical protein